ncbi:MAG TPA: GNAT family N-acetyltransferase [Pirellulales bacterium]|jgi:GNAT superfamily N-acetyltransferase
MTDSSVTPQGNAAIIVRPLVADDFATACALLAELGRPAVTPQTREQVRRTFEQHVSAADTASLIAERNGQPIGMLSLHFRQRLSQPVPEAWIPDFIVVEKEHGGGAAQALMGCAVELARERGCHRLVLESHYHRQRAYRFYAREGFADVGKCFSLQLLPPEES